jgi:ankyrin repeat protein
MEGSLNVIQTLLDRGVDCNAKDNARETPLHFAVRRQELNIIQLLLRHGVNLKSTNMYGQTPKDVLVEILNDKNFHGSELDNILNIINILDSHGLCSKRAR